MESLVHYRRSGADYQSWCGDNGDLTFAISRITCQPCIARVLVVKRASARDLSIRLTYLNDPMPKFQQRHHDAIADALTTARKAVLPLSQSKVPDYGLIVACLLDMFEADDSQFDRAQFLDRVRDANATPR